MIITGLKFKNFRNYDEIIIKDFSPKLNIICGNNAQGKTNLLEGINLCANGKSFRSGSGFIKLNKKCAYISVDYIKNKQKNTIELLLNEKQKSIKVNGINKQFLKDLLGNLYVVSFCPEDIKTAKENPGLRRRFLDLEISKLRPVYVDALKKYAKLIAEKNAALRNINEDKIEDILEVYNKQLEEYIKIILVNREKYVDKINEYIHTIHKRISGKEEIVTVSYLSTFDKDNIAKNLKQIMKKEREERKCNYGPHRDDIIIKIDNNDVKNYASQGQIRTAMLSLKIACLKILKETTNVSPIFLMDDVFSELDNTRKENLLKAVKNIQVFITTADKKDAEIEGKKYIVENGKLV